MLADKIPTLSTWGAFFEPRRGGNPIESKSYRNRWWRLQFPSKSTRNMAFGGDHRFLKHARSVSQTDAVLTTGAGARAASRVKVGRPLADTAGV
jgi:hypothetical protein